MHRRRFLALSAGLPFFAEALLSARSERMLQMNGYAVNAETPLELLTDYITPSELFFVRSHWIPHMPDLGTWRLKVHGEVRTPLELSLAELRRMPAAEA